MRITAVKQQAKNPERVSLFVDEKYAFSLSLDELVKYKIKNGDELTPGQLKKFKKLSADGKLRQRALEWLLNRPHSSREFTDYIRRKKADEELSASLIKEFSSKGYLDDAKFAVWFTELQARRGRSDRAIRSELFKKGVGRETADKALASEEESEADRLKAVIEKKSKHGRYRSDKQALAKYLIGQGFSYGEVKSALKMDYFD